MYMDRKSDILYAKNTKNMKNYDKPLMHCNFGQGGQSNGWYVYSVFNSTDGSIILDDPTLQMQQYILSVRPKQMVVERTAHPRCQATRRIAGRRFKIVASRRQQRHYASDDKIAGTRRGQLCLDRQIVFRYGQDIVVHLRNVCRAVGKIKRRDKPVITL